MKWVHPKYATKSLIHKLTFKSNTVISFAFIATKKDKSYTK